MVTNFRIVLYRIVVTGLHAAMFVRVLAFVMCSGVNLVHSLGGRKKILPSAARNSLFLGTKQLNIE